MNHFLGPTHLSMVWTGRPSSHRLSLSSKRSWAIDLKSTRKIGSIYAADYQSLNESKIKENCRIYRVWIIDICAVCLEIVALLSLLSRTYNTPWKFLFVILETTINLCKRENIHCYFLKGAIWDSGREKKTPTGLGPNDENRVKGQTFCKFCAYRLWSFVDVDEWWHTSYEIICFLYFKVLSCH